MHGRKIAPPPPLCFPSRLLLLLLHLLHLRCRHPLLLHLRLGPDLHSLPAPAPPWIVCPHPRRRRRRSSFAAPWNVFYSSFWRHPPRRRRDFHPLENLFPRKDPLLKMMATTSSLARPSRRRRRSSTSEISPSTMKERMPMMMMMTMMMMRYRPRPRLRPRRSLRPVTRERLPGRQESDVANPEPEQRRGTWAVAFFSHHRGRRPADKIKKNNNHIGCRRRRRWDRCLTHPPRRWWWRS